MSKIFAQILIPNALNEDFSYFSNEKIIAGNIVKVEFGRKIFWGLVIKISKQAPENFDEKKIKEVLEINQRISLDKNLIEFIEKISSYNLANRGMILKAFIGILNSDKVKKIPLGLVQKVDSQKFNLKKLNIKQQEIFDKFQNLNPQISLLDGVTGSGKTEIYFNIIAEILKKDSFSQILILLPEIALTSQILQRFEEQFGFRPALWHSKISKKEKREIFYGIIEGSIKVVIGARSALLLPFKKLQLTIIDEEHDQSFKQEDLFNFHARDMAILKAKIDNSKVILSSATPAIETFINAGLKKYQQFKIDFEENKKNKISLIDLRQEKLPKGNFLSKLLKDEISQNLINNKQTLLFLNRRGFAPVSLCKKCGQKIDCPNCDFHLVYHKLKNLLICHHCGHNEKSSKMCKSCGEENSIISVGAGIERIEEEVKEFFPNAKIALVTSDVISNFNAASELVKKISNNEVDIIIGTQMISKGYDFANITLVGIIDADSMLYSSNIRALERTYQILTQVAGRTGRRKEKGKVVIQTFNPDNFIFDKICNYDRDSFYEFEANNREILDLPPFSRIIKLEVSSFKEFEAKNFAKKLIQHFPCSDKIEILGPAPSPIQKLKNRHHFLINIKASRKVNLQKLIKDVILSIQTPNSIRIRIDVDPV